jgi:hypothetical protein
MPIMQKLSTILSTYFLFTLSFANCASAQWGSSGNNIFSTTSGNVGIGTPTPAWGKLNITFNNGQQSGVQNNSLLAIEDNTYTTAGMVNTRINWINANGLRIASIYAAHNAYGSNNSDLAFETNNGTASVERIRITSSGNVGIGTSDSKGYKLAVAGGIIGESVTVKLQSNWPDYVFEDSYKLPSLPQLESYINQYHHLPEIPSARDVNQEGLDLGEMNKLLTKKVEELTLYLIEKDKAIKDQDNRVKKLEMFMTEILSKNSSHR